MSDRTFGWVQDSGEIAALKRIAAIFVRDSETHRYLKEYAIPRYVPERCGKKALLDALAQPGELTYEYGMLKGKGDSSTTQLTVRENIEMFGIAESEAQKRVAARGRGNAACSGLIQAVLVAQKKFESTGESKPYQGDWPAECFLRLAVSIGMLDYCAATDTCALSETGKRYYETAEGSLEERNLLISMFLSCPPVVRVLSLLADSDGMTKFEIGSRLGFVGEAGFTTVPQNYFAYACNVIDVDKSVLEGTADKYARMIGGWLVKIKLAEKNKRFYTESYLNREYEVDLEAYRATEEGRRRLRQLAGYSSRGKTSKIVLKEMIQNGCYNLARHGYVTGHVHIFVGYQDEKRQWAKASVTMRETTNTYSIISKYVDKMFEDIVDKSKEIRRLGYDFLGLLPIEQEQYDFFTDINKIEKEKNIVKSVIKLQDKYGRNAVLKGVDLKEGATQRDRNALIGGHNSE